MTKEKARRIERFKQFVRKHPQLIEEVKNSERTWQQTYEDWLVLGEDHEIWEPYRQKNGGKNIRKTPDNAGNKKQTAKGDDPLKAIFSLLKNIDLQQINEYVSQFNGTLSGVQELLEQFQKNKPGTRPPEPWAYPSWSRYGRR